MAVSRRKVLALVGGGMVVAAARFAATRTPERALAPWEGAGAPYEPRRRALSFALLAPSPHNRQPWLADLSQPDAVILYADPERRLPVTDPFDRQITIGLGCFIELMAMAAAQGGHAVDVALFPDGADETQLDARPIAVARFRSGAAQPDPLFSQTLARRSAKVPFALDRAVAPETLAALAAAATGAVRVEATAEPARVARLRALTWDAWQAEALAPAAFGESVALMRLGRAEIEANPDGIDIGGPMLEAMMLSGLLTREAMATPGTTAYETGWDMYREMLAATPAYVWLTTGGNSRVDQIAAGRAWLRINLAAIALGVGLHPVSQCLQEYAEMAPHFAAAHATLARPGETVQMLGRVGYAAPQPPTPRWPLETRLMDG